MEEYSTDIVCTYLNLPKNSQHAMYAIQFFQIMKINKWNDDIINSKTEKIFNTLKDIYKYNNKSEYLKNCHINNIICKLRQSENIKFITNIFGDDDLTLFRLLFGLELFQYSHSYFCHILNNYKIDNTNNTLYSFNIFDNFDLLEYEKKNDLLVKSYNNLLNNII